MIEIENIVIVVNAEGGVTDEMVTLEVGFENFEILLLIFFGDLGMVVYIDLVLVVGDRLINWGEFLVNFGDVSLAGGEKTEAVAGEKDIPREKCFGGELFMFE